MKTKAQLFVLSSSRCVQAHQMKEMLAAADLWSHEAFRFL